MAFRNIDAEDMLHESFSINKQSITNNIWLIVGIVVIIVVIIFLAVFGYRYWKNKKAVKENYSMDQRSKYSLEYMNNLN